MHANRNPDGSFEFEAIRYQLEQASDDTFDLVREADRETVGELQVTARTNGEPTVTVLPGAALPEVVDAISLLMARPRGAFPLQ